MPEDLAYLWWPLLACLVLTGIHAYLGIHVIERGVIFVDLALAQIAALGATIALLVGDFAFESEEAYFLSLGFTLLGAAIFALTRMRSARVPQEAVIGIVYAVASAAAIVVIAAANDPHGSEHLQDLLAGNVLWVKPGTILKTAIVYAAVGAFHFVFRKRFLRISLDPEGAARDGMNLPLWDFLFYATFGFVITSSVQIAGVLLVFSFLIVPAVFAMLFAKSLLRRLIVGWGLGAAVSFVGLLGSYRLPSGPAIVVLFGAVLLVAGLGRYVWLAERRWAALARVAAGAAVVAGLVGAAALLKPPHAKPHVHGPPEAEESHEVTEGEADAALDGLDADLLLMGLEEAETAHDRLRYAAALHRQGHPRGRAELEALAEHDDEHVREEARRRLGR